MIFFTSQRLISGSFAGSLSEGISEAVDQHENATRRWWVSGGMRQRQASGRWTGNVPIGYRRKLVDRPDGSRGWDGDLEPYPDTGPIVRSIFDRFARGEGSRAIALDLNARGVRSVRGVPWRSNSIDRILSNPAYTGRLIRYGRHRSRHYFDHVSNDGHADFGERFPALIDPTLFDQVARLRASRTRPRGRLGRRTYPLSGTLRCRQCGNTMTGVAARGTRYYRCGGRRLLGICTAPSIRADKAEAAFASWLGSHRLPADWRDAIARTNVREARAGERDRQAVLSERLKRLRDMYAWGHIDEAEYRQQHDEIKTAMGVMAMPSIPGIEAVAAVLADLEHAWSSATPDQQAALPPLVLKSAEVEDGRVATWVVDAGLRPLLEACVVVPDAYVTIGR